MPRPRLPSRSGSRSGWPDSARTTPAAAAASGGPARPELELSCCSEDLPEARRDPANRPRSTGGIAHPGDSRRPGERGHLGSGRFRGVLERNHARDRRASRRTRDHIGECVVERTDVSRRSHCRRPRRRTAGRQHPDARCRRRRMSSRIATTSLMASGRDGQRDLTEEQFTAAVVHRTVRRSRAGARRVRSGNQCACTSITPSASAWAIDRDGSRSRSSGCVLAVQVLDGGEDQLGVTDVLECRAAGTHPAPKWKYRVSPAW